jgi:hypothetical protein
LPGEEGSDFRIQDPRARTNGVTSRAAATIIWEDFDRPSQEVYYEAPGSYAEDMAPNPHAFLLGLRDAGATRLIFTV